MLGPSLSGEGERVGVGAFPASPLDALVALLLFAFLFAFVFGDGVFDAEPHAVKITITKVSRKIVFIF